MTNEELTFQTLGPTLHDELPPPFTTEEYEERWRRVRSAMEAAGIDTIYVSDPADLCYLTGYQLAWYRDAGAPEWIAAAGLAVNLDDNPPIFFDTSDERLIGTATSCTTDYRVYEYPAQDTAEAGAYDQMTTFIADTLAAAGWLKGAVGLQPWSYRPAPGYSHVFGAALEAHGARVADASRLVAQVRQRKSERELVYIREAARLGDLGMQAAVDAITTGATELEVWAAATAAMARHGGELSAIPGMVNSGPKCASLHGLASRRKIQHGDLVNIDMCGVCNRYHANLGRTIALGEPPPELRIALEKAPALRREVAAGLKAGMSFRSLLELNERAAMDLGIWDDRWWVGGYDLGIAFAPDWVGGFYFSAGEDPGDQTLEPGMVMNHEFNFYLPNGWGIRELIETMIVTEDRVEFVHAFPIELTVVQ